MTTKADLHQLVDALAEDELDAARQLLERLGHDPVVRAFMLAPEDDEPETDEERRSVEEAVQEIREGRGRSWEDVRRDLGID